MQSRPGGRAPRALSSKTEEGGRKWSALPESAEACWPGDWRTAPLSWLSDLARPGRGVPGRGRPRSTRSAPPAAAAAPATAPPPAPPLWPPRACLSSGLCKAIGRSACPPGAPTPGPAIPAAHVASSVPAAAIPSHAPGPAAAATRGRGLAARVGRAAADGAVIKGRPREQPVATRPAPDPAGGLEQVSGGAPGTASGDHFRARRTPSPAGPVVPPSPPATTLWPDPRPLSSGAAPAVLDAQPFPRLGRRPRGLPLAQSPAGPAVGSQRLGHSRRGLTGGSPAGPAGSTHGEVIGFHLVFQEGRREGVGCR